MCVVVVVVLDSILFMVFNSHSNLSAVRLHAVEFIILVLLTRLFSRYWLDNSPDVV